MAVIPSPLCLILLERMWNAGTTNSPAVSIHGTTGRDFGKNSTLCEQGVRACLFVVVVAVCLFACSLLLSTVYFQRKRELKVALKSPRVETVVRSLPNRRVAVVRKGDEKNVSRAERYFCDKSVPQSDPQVTLRNIVRSAREVQDACVVGDIFFSFII